MNKLHSILVKPVDTEKSYYGNKSSCYTFVVEDAATKTEIKQAVERYYGVKVKSVKTLTTHPKARLVGRGNLMVKKPSYKKAIITTIGAKPLDVNKIKA